MQRSAFIGDGVVCAQGGRQRCNLRQDILSGHYTIAPLAAIFVVCFFIGPWSFASATPGGLFTPMLMLGACLGALCGEGLNHFIPGSAIPTLACAAVGMGALFSGSVGAPLTGMLLTVEMTGRADLTLVLLVASLTTMVVAVLHKSEPIFETLKRRMLEQAQTEQPIARRTSSPVLP